MQILDGHLPVKVNNRNTETKCEICWELRINTPERRQWRRSGVFILNWAYFTSCSWVVIVDIVKLSTRLVVSVNLSKDAFYITYSDIKKRVRIDFIVYKI